MTKTDLLTAIYQVENQINALQGKSEINLDTLPAGRLEEEANRAKRYHLIDRLERAQLLLAKTTIDKQIEQQAAAYFATPEGSAYRQQTEEELQVRELAIKASIRQSSQQIEATIQSSLGEHWAVARYYPGELTIAIIDPEHSTPHKAFFFGQDIEIYYNLQSNYKAEQEERFETNVGACGSFRMDRGNKLGERALFYVGIGKLFSNTDLLATLKQLMRNSCETIDKLQTELKAIKEELKNPSPAIPQV